MSCLSSSFRIKAPRVTGCIQKCPSSVPRPPLVSSGFIRCVRCFRPQTAHKGKYSYHYGPLDRVLEATSISFISLSAVSLAVTAFYFSAHQDWQSPVLTQPKSVDDSCSSYLSYNMSTDLAPGRPENLTSEQEDKLRQFWTAIFNVSGVDGVTDITVCDNNNNNFDEGELSDSARVFATTKDTGKRPEVGKERIKVRSLFRKSKKDNSSTDSASTTNKVASTAAVNSDDDKYGQSKIFLDALASMSPETIRFTIWSMVKHDDPDALVLRFLRARKWNIDKALAMLVSTVHWRHQEMMVDDDIMKNGEGAAAELENYTDDKSKLSHDFLEQMRIGKSFLHGFDKAGRPICVVRVRLHHQGDHSEESLERCTVYIIETARMLLQPPVDTATIIFDMTNFSLANMDYSPVRFMIKCFEANYPESLGVVLVHKAPWIFQGIWKIIRGWLDPVVANKVNFTNSVEDMEQFIDRGHILKEMDGNENWEYKYIEPKPKENDLMKETATRDRLLAERENLYREYEAATTEWITHPPGSKKAKELRAKRSDISRRLRIGYWKLDPYVRARSLYDRVGLLLADGSINRGFYKGIDEASQTSAEVKIPANTTSTRDQKDISVNNTK